MKDPVPKQWRIKSINRTCLCDFSPVTDDRAEMRLFTCNVCHSAVVAEKNRLVTENHDLLARLKEGGK